MIEDRWIPTACYMCYSTCGVRAHRINGVVADIRGDPDNPQSQGKVCAKGKAGLMGLYDPYRVTQPLKRTNPEKGIGIDPGWVEISWDEALDIITKKLKEIKEENPRLLLDLGLDFQISVCRSIFASAFGTPNFLGGTPTYYCGAALHLVHYMMEGAFQGEPDFEHCNYTLMVGGQEGFQISLLGTFLARRMAEARARGMKLVVVDPVCGVAAAKADEWVPIRPGTDGAFALGLMNLLINELGLYDAPFIKKYTNGPYLVGEDGYYIRDAPTGKPLVWDTAHGQARTYDSSVEDCALDGSYLVGGRSCRPAFELLKEHVKAYTPERVADVTSIAPPIIRHIAADFGQAAKIGSDIVINGVKYPYRPALCIWRRGAGAHQHGGLSSLALEMLNVVIGAVDVPGGLNGCRTMTPFGGPKEGPDGLIVPSDFALTEHRPYPGRRLEPPTSLTLQELFPLAYGPGPAFEEGVINPEKYSLNYRAKALLHIHSNVMLTASNPGRMAQLLSSVPFMVSFSTYPTETSGFADILLPDAHYLERLQLVATRGNSYAVGSGCWYWTFQQPVVEAPKGVRSWPEVLVEVVHRLGIQRDFNMMFNTMLRLKEPFKLDHDKEYSWSEMVDCWTRSWFGPQHGVEWLKEHGFYRTEKRVEDRYPRIFLKPRIPIYFEHFKKAGKELEKLTQELGLAWDVSDYRSLPDWLPCQAHQGKGNDFDLYAVTYKLPFVTHSATAQNPWLTELAEHHYWGHRIMINSATANSKGIKDGDVIWVESSSGKVQGRARVTDAIHPEVVGMAWAFGHWAEGMAAARGKGPSFNTLLAAGLDQLDKLSGGQDCCTRVKVYEA